jgi:hypothetical protein
MSRAGGPSPGVPVVTSVVDAIPGPLITSCGSPEASTIGGELVSSAADDVVGDGQVAAFQHPGAPCASIRHESEVRDPMCLFLSLIFFGPRAVIILWGLIEPVRWSTAFDTFILPLLGFLFVPWTTLMYVLVAPLGIEGLDWLWLGLALVADVASYAGGAVGGRGRVPGYGSPS